jgi:CheY-like chemotaxis protein
MAMKIVILEDNEDRQAAMRRCLEDRFYQFESRFFDDAAAMIAFLEKNLSDTIVISLDHDLEMRSGPKGGTADPGTGRQVADFLAQKSPVCPVIIATTNSAAALGMELTLQEAGWQTRRVLPFNDLEWIPTEWFRSVRRAIVGSAKKKVENPTRE